MHGLAENLAVFSTWRACLVLLRWWVRPCMVLTMCGRDAPTSIYTPPDASFIDMLDQNCCLAGPHSSPAVVEVFRTMSPTFIKYGGYILPGPERSPISFGTFCYCADTCRVSPFRPDGPEPPLRCRRFAYGYALDGSEFPCYLRMRHSPVFRHFQRWSFLLVSQ